MERFNVKITEINCGGGILEVLGDRILPGDPDTIEPVKIEVRPFDVEANTTFTLTMNANGVLGYKRPEGAIITVDVREASDSKYDYDLCSAASITLEDRINFISQYLDAGLSETYTAEADRLETETKRALATSDIFHMAVSFNWSLAKPTVIQRDQQPPAFEHNPNLAEPLREHLPREKHTPDYTVKLPLYAEVSGKRITVNNHPASDAVLIGYVVANDHNLDKLHDAAQNYAEAIEKTLNLDCFVRVGNSPTLGRQYPKDASLGTTLRDAVKALENDLESELIYVSNKIEDARSALLKRLDSFGIN